MGKIEDLNAKVEELRQKEIEAKRLQIEKLQQEIMEIEGSTVIDAPASEVVQNAEPDPQASPESNFQGIPVKFVLMLGMTQDNQLFWDIKGPTNIAELAGIVEYANRVVDKFWQQVDSNIERPTQPTQEGAEG